MNLSTTFEGIDPSFLALSSAQMAVLEARKSPAFMGNWLTDGFYKNPKHLVYLSDVLADAIEEGDGRIIVCAPPRHGKSELIDVNIPTWTLWNHPEWRVILAGHSATFAATWGRKTRDLICEHYNKLGIKIIGGFDAAMDEWRTDKGGGMRTAGVGVGITGLGANVFIIDDPTADTKQAFSSTHQQDLREWYQGVVDRRLEPHATVIVTMQRWPGSDFVSWLNSMQAQGRANWKVINLAALYCENDPLGGPGPAKFWVDPIGRNPLANGGVGEALWRERWNEDDLIAKAQSSEDPSFWHSQYQQRPPDNTGIGVAYHNFSATESVRDVKYNPKLPLLWALDFNVDPMTSLICQCETDFSKSEYDFITGIRSPESLRKTITILEEIYIHNSNTQAACAEFVKRTAKYQTKNGGKLEVQVYGDASGHHRKTTGKTDYKIIEEELRQLNLYDLSIKAVRSNPGQRDRVNTVNVAFINAAGERRLFVSPNCLELRRDLVSMKWHRTADGKATSDLDDSDPNRGHISDALGYLVWAMLKLRKKIGAKGERIL